MTRHSLSLDSDRQNSLFGSDECIQITTIRDQYKVSSSSVFDEFADPIKSPNFLVTGDYQQHFFLRKSVSENFFHQLDKYCHARFHITSTTSKEFVSHDCGFKLMILRGRDDINMTIEDNVSPFSALIGVIIGEDERRFVIVGDDLAFGVKVGIDEIKSLTTGNEIRTHRRDTNEVTSEGKNRRRHEEW
jgi:hypothetical protein